MKAAMEHKRRGEGVNTGAAQGKPPRGAASMKVPGAQQARLG